MKYFLHDTSAFSDEKITMLHMEFGFEGVGLFYTILERIAQQEKPVLESVLKAQLGIRKKLQKQLDFMYEIDLLSIKNGEVFNENLMNFSKKYQIKKEKTRKRVSQWREKQKDTENVTRYERVRNNPKVKESKVKESKVNNSVVVSSETPTAPKKSLAEKLEEKKADFKKWFLEAIATCDNPNFWKEENYKESTKFYEYWIEHTPNARKLRWEKEKAFDIKRRMKTWEEKKNSQTNGQNGYKTAQEKREEKYKEVGAKLQADIARRAYNRDNGIKEQEYEQDW